MKSSTRDEAEGKMHQVKGKIKEIAGKVTMSPDKGIVQLSGFVNSQKAVDKAGQIARSVQGVTSVRNDLIVK